jgi:uncharacterized protein
MKYVKKGIAFIALGYLFAAIAVYWMQDSLLYAPMRGTKTPQEVGLANVQVLNLASAAGEKLVAWYTPAPSNKPTILFFHGKGGSISGRTHRFTYYTSKGYGALFLSYRGYGASSGSPSRDGIMSDAEKAYDWLTANGVKAEKILVVGESMGTGVAALLAARRPVAGVSLEAPYSSIEDIAVSRYWWLPVHFLIKPNFDPVNEIAKIRAPILMQQGDQDESIPIEFGRELFKAANQPKEFFTIPGGTHAIFNEPTWARELAFFEKVIAQ